MNIKDLAPGSYTVIEDEESKPLNINDLPEGSYTEVEAPEDTFQAKLIKEQEKIEQLKAEQDPGMLGSAVVGASTLGDHVGGRHAAAGIMGLRDYMTGKYPELGEAYAANKKDIDMVRDRAYEANPASYIGGSVAGGVATGGAAAKGAQLLGGGIKGAVGASTIEGAAQGLGSSRAEDLEGLAKDAAMGGALGGGISGVTGVMGKVANKVPDFIPAAREGDTIGNKVAATMSPRRLLPGTTKQDLLDYFSNPELRKKASVTDVSNEVSKLSSTLGDEMTASKKAVQDIYGELEDKAVGEISGAPGDVLDSALQTIKNNPKDMFSAKVKSAIKTAKSIAEGKSTKTAGQPDGTRLLEARRFLDKGVGDRKTLSKLDNELIDEARGELQSVLRQSEPMRQADDLYSEFKKVRKGVEDKVFSGPKGAKELDPEKLRRALTTTTLKGEAFEESLNTYDQFIKSNPRLANSPEVQTAKASLDKLKEVIDVGQLEYKLSKSGGPTAEAAFLVAQGLGSSMFGPAAFMGLPLMNPTVWSAIVDNVSPTAQALMKNIEKAAPIIKSAAVREIVKQEQRKD